MQAPKINFKQCHASNYRVGVNKKIKFLVIHYTGNNGDTAAGNASYFANTDNLKASAGYFVDGNEFWQSVKDSDIAYHCGATTYKHPYCRNSNSIGIEICSKKDAQGNFYFEPQAISNAIILTRYLMDLYNIPIDCVIRHYDCTGKNCPAPFVQDYSQWVDFKKRLMEGVIDMALEKWQIEGGEAALDSLAKKGLINTPDTKRGEKNLAAPVPAYMFWMMLNRLADYKGGK